MSDKKNYKFISNKECEFFPCHHIDGLNCEEFNCLFCYCPLYALGENCGGEFRYTENGIKDCSSCSVPHKKENYDFILSKLPDIVDMVRKK